MCVVVCMGDVRVEVSVYEKNGGSWPAVMGVWGCEPIGNQKGDRKVRFYVYVD